MDEYIWAGLMEFSFLGGLGHGWPTITVCCAIGTGVTKRPKSLAIV
jgi:hypothetical protein